jgi:hypothetical protein
MQIPVLRFDVPGVKASQRLGLYRQANPCNKIDEEPENSRARYLTVEEQGRLFEVLKDELQFSE